MWWGVKGLRWWALAAIVCCLTIAGVVVHGDEVFDCVSDRDGEREDRRATTSTLVLGTFNLKWAFDGIEDNSRSEYCCQDDSASNARNHFRELSAVIARNDPDILVVQEVEDCAALRTILSFLPHNGTNPTLQEYLVKGTDTFTQQNVGLLSKVDPSSSLTRREDREAFPSAGSSCGLSGSLGRYDSGVSKHLVADVDVEIGGEEGGSLPKTVLNITVIGVHFKARPTEKRSCAQREAQAMVIREIASEAVTRRREVVILGDVNDFDEEYIDVNGNIPTSRVLSILSSAGGNGDTSMFKVSSMLRVEDRWTYQSGSKQPSSRSLIDHLLISPGLRPFVVRAWIDHSHDPETVSDHYPFFVELQARASSADTSEGKKQNSRALISESSDTDDQRVYIWAALCVVVLTAAIGFFSFKKNRGCCHKDTQPPSSRPIMWTKNEMDIQMMKEKSKLEM